MNGKLNMRRNIKEPSESKTSNLDESIVSEETVNSGNYNDAQKILQKSYATGDLLAEMVPVIGSSVIPCEILAIEFAVIGATIIKSEFLARCT